MPSIRSILLHFGLFASAVVNASPLQALVRRQYPAVGACSGVCQGRLHDPAVIYREDTDDYWRFTTNDGIHVARAPTISGPWEDLGPALPDGSIIDKPGNKDLWAPDVFFHSGLYYMYYSVSAMGSQDSDIGVATSPTMAPATWTDHGSIGLPTDGKYNRIDANLYMFDPARPVLNFGSFWTNIWQAPMAPDLLSINGELTHIAQNTTHRGNGLVDGSMEGAYMFAWKGYTYLFLSSGNCCNEPSPTGDGLPPPGEEYRVVVCRYSEQSGGFVDQEGRDCLTENGGTRVLGSHDDVYAPGGQGVMLDPQQGAAVMYYHYVRPSVSYSYDRFFFGWSKLDFSSGWPVVVA